MVPANISISYILPIKELYSNEHYGAVSLVVSEFINHSYHDQHYVFGKSHKLKLHKHGNFVPRKIINILFIKKSLLYGISCLLYIQNKFRKKNIIEIHNRPKMFKYFNFFSNKIIIFFHNDPLGMESSRSINERMKLLKSASALFFNSNYTKSRFLEKMNVSDDMMKKCQTVYCGFDFQKFSYNHSIKQKSIIFVGRLVPEKGCLQFLKAFYSIQKECPEWKLVIVGPKTSKNSTYVEEVNNVLNKIENKIDYYEYQSHEEVINLFAASEIACLPSLWQEPFGRVVMESMAMGCATITSKRGGIPEITSDCAITIEPTEENLKAAIMKLTTDSKFRKTMQINAHQRIKEKFDLKKNTKRIDELRRKIFEDNR